MKGTEDIRNELAVLKTELYSTYDSSDLLSIGSDLVAMLESLLTCACGANLTPPQECDDCEKDNE